MSKRKNGGPVHPTGYVEVFDDWPGMTLRDWFAGQAIHSLIANRDASQYGHNDLAQEAYQIAEAMVEVKNTYN